MHVQLDDDRRRLDLLVDDARYVEALHGCDAPGLADLRAEILARLDQHAEVLEERQRSALSLMDEALSSSRAASVPVDVENANLWAPVWRPPAGAAAPADGVLTRLPVNPSDPTRPQLARVLTIVGALLIVCGLLIAVL